MFCKPPHPVYIVLFRGDDTDFVGNQEIIVKITTERNISGCKAYFKYMGNIQTFDEIPENKELHLVFSREQTKEMPLGTWDAELYLIDENGKRMTVNNRIHMLVTNSVCEAYCPEDPQAITVTMSGDKFLKDAEVSGDGKTLTITKSDGTKIPFSGGGGTDDYNDLKNRPSINGKTLTGNVELATPEQLELKADKTDLEGFATEADLLAFYYPGGGVTSMDQITTNGIEYAVGEDGGAYVVKGEGLTGRVVLPWKVTIEGAEYKVTAIGAGAFDGLVHSSSFNSFTAPITVKSIGSEAFESCHFLASVHIPSATSIDGYAFSDCILLASANLPSATSIGGYAFSGCGSLATVSLPSATSIEEYAFGNCSSLATANLPSATSIGNAAFSSCSSLATVDFGSSPKSLVPVLDTYAFVGVPTSCKFIVPLGMYDEWISAPAWSELYAAGYRFEGYASTAQIENKADKATTLAGYGITDAATKTELAALTAKVEYPLYAVPSTGILKDRAINTTSLSTVTVPDNFTDLLIRASVASSLAVTMPAAITKYGDTFPGEAGEYLITITKTGAAEAYVRTIKLEVANA